MRFIITFLAVVFLAFPLIAGESATTPLEQKTSPPSTSVLVIESPIEVVIGEPIAATSDSLKMERDFIKLERQLLERVMKLEHQLLEREWNNIYGWLNLVLIILAAMTIFAMVYLAKAKKEVDKGTEKTAQSAREVEEDKKEVEEDKKKTGDFAKDAEAHAFFTNGNLHVEQKKYDEAIEDYTQAIRLKPNFINAYYNRGYAKGELKQHDAAIVDYTKAIDINPNFADAYVNRGYAKGKLEQYDAAIEDYTQAIRLKPDDADAYVNRGYAKERLKHYDAAIEDYNQTIRLKPDDADAYVNRGRAELSREDGNTEVAKQDLANACKLLQQQKRLDEASDAMKVLKMFEAGKSNEEILKEINRLVEKYM